MILLVLLGSLVCVQLGYLIASLKYDDVVERQEAFIRELEEYING